jgi:hypothetical protein
MGDAAALYGLYGSSAVGSGDAASEWWREANAAISGPKNSSAPLDTDSWNLMGSFARSSPPLLADGSEKRSTSNKIRVQRVDQQR